MTHCVTIPLPTASLFPTTCPLPQTSLHPHPCADSGLHGVTNQTACDIEKNRSGSSSVSFLLQEQTGSYRKSPGKSRGASFIMYIQGPGPLGSIQDLQISAFSSHYQVNPQKIYQISSVVLIIPLDFATLCGNDFHNFFMKTNNV